MSQTSRSKPANPKADEMSCPLRLIEDDTPALRSFQTGSWKYSIVSGNTAPNPGGWKRPPATGRDACRYISGQDLSLNDADETGGNRGNGEGFRDVRLLYQLGQEPPNGSALVSHSVLSACFCSKEWFRMRRSGGIANILLSGSPKSGAEATTVPTRLVIEPTCRALKSKRLECHQQFSFFSNAGFLTGQNRHEAFAFGQCRLENRR